MTTVIDSIIVSHWSVCVCGPSAALCKWNTHRHESFAECVKQLRTNSLRAPGIAAQPHHSAWETKQPCSGSSHDAVHSH